MTKEEKKEIRLARAKRTAFGRFLCRLFGDEIGQGLMEWVVLAVLLVAAAVGTVILFGRYMRAECYTAMLAMMGKTEAAKTNQETLGNTAKTDIDAVNAQGNAIDGNESKATEANFASPSGN